MVLVASCSARAVSWGSSDPHIQAREYSKESRDRKPVDVVLSLPVWPVLWLRLCGLPSWCSSSFCGIWGYSTGPKLCRTDQNPLSGKRWNPDCVMIPEADDSRNEGLWELSGVVTKSSNPQKPPAWVAAFSGWEWAGFWKLGSEPEFSKQAQWSLKMRGNSEDMRGFFFVRHKAVYNGACSWA